MALCLKHINCSSYFLSLFSISHAFFTNPFSLKLYCVSFSSLDAFVPLSFQLHPWILKILLIIHNITKTMPTTTANFTQFLTGRTEPSLGRRCATSVSTCFIITFLPMRHQRRLQLSQTWLCEFFVRGFSFKNWWWIFHLERLSVFCLWICASIKDPWREVRRIALSVSLSVHFLWRGKLGKKKSWEAASGRSQPRSYIRDWKSTLWAGELRASYGVVASPAAQF